MALFTDGPLPSIEDLTAQDSQLLERGQRRGDRRDAEAGAGTGRTRHGAVRAAEPVEQRGPDFCAAAAGPNLADVVVTPPLKLWHTFRTLEMVYADAYNSQLNDRYAGKRDQFHERAKWAYEKLMQIGLGMVTAAGAAGGDAGT